MNLRKIRFWSTEEQLMLYTKVSCVSAFGHYLMSLKCLVFQI